MVNFLKQIYFNLFCLESEYKVINNQITIKNLTKSHNNLVFHCLAVQKINIIDKYNAITNEEHQLTVNVYCKYFNFKSHF